MFYGLKVIALSQRVTSLSVCVLNYVSVEFVYVYGCLSVWMVVCVCDRLSSPMSGLVSMSVRLPNYMVLVSVLFSIGLLCAYILMYPFSLMSNCVSACVYVCLISHGSVSV